MKKIMIWATMLLTLCACQNNNNTTTEAEELPLPETIEEFVERLDSMDSFFEHTMNSDSTTTSYSRIVCNKAIYDLIVISAHNATTPTCSVFIYFAI